jgi:uncharacterized protein with HEPN domain
MPDDGDSIRLRHMLDAARKAIEFSEGRTREDLDRDEMYALALVRLIEIVGEAARAVSQRTKDDCPAVPWRAIVGTRDRLAHGYFDVDLDIVWAIVTAHLPDLVREVERLLGLR